MKGRDIDAEMARLFKLPLVTATRTARVLKEAEGDLYSTPGRGNDHVLEPSHAVNFAIALACREPINGPQKVATYRALLLSSIRLQDGPDYLPPGAEIPTSIGSVPLAATFGETLNSIVSAFVTEGRHAAHELLFVDLYLDEENPGAALEVRAQGVGRLRVGYSGSRTGADPTVDYSTRIWLNTFRVLADIQARAAQELGPERKTPGTDGATNTSAPAPTRTTRTNNDRSRTRETGQLTNPEAKRVCAASQALAAPRTGRSCLSSFSLQHGDDHEADRFGGPAPAC